MTCSRPQRNVHRPGFEPGTPWSEIRRPNHCTTPPPQNLRKGTKNTIALKRQNVDKTILDLQTHLHPIVGNPLLATHCWQPIVDNPLLATLGTCKFCKQSRVCALVCLHDLQLPREIFPVFSTTGGLIFILSRKNADYHSSHMFIK